MNLIKLSGALVKAGVNHVIKSNKILVQSKSTPNPMALKLKNQILKLKIPTKPDRNQNTLDNKRMTLGFYWKRKGENNKDNYLTVYWEAKNQTVDIEGGIVDFDTDKHSHAWMDKDVPFKSEKDIPKIIKKIKSKAKSKLKEIL